MSKNLSCPHCGERFRAPNSTVTLQCPHCDSIIEPVRATSIASSTGSITTVYPKHVHDQIDPRGPTSVLIGFALVPCGIPLIWLIAPMLSGKETVFTYAVPIALAFCCTGLSLGLVWSAEWSFQTRLKGILAFLLLGYGIGGFLFFLKPAWVEAVRRNMGGGQNEWQTFSPDDGSYSAKVPGPPVLDPKPLIAGWDIKCYRYNDRRNHSDIFLLGHGKVPLAVQGFNDDQFFDAVGQAAAEAVEGTLTNEIRTERDGNPKRRFVITLADKATTRTVMVIRVGEQAYVAAVQGAFLPADAKDVAKFFLHFSPRTRKP